MGGGVVAHDECSTARAAATLAAHARCALPPAPFPRPHLVSGRVEQALDALKAGWASGAEHNVDGHWKRGVRRPEGAAAASVSVRWRWCAQQSDALWCTERELM